MRSLLARAFMLTFAAAWGNSGGSAGSMPTAPGGQGSQACRTYITAGTNVSDLGVFTATTTFTAAYNAATRQTTTTSNYTDTRGIRQAWVAVTTYRSTADVVDEVKVIPPLTLSTGTMSTGDIAYALTNSYDGQDRLTGFTSVALTGTATTRYTSWDASSRPTAGSTTVAGNTLSLSVSYDDAARASTTETRSGSTAARGVQTFDPNGNPTVYVQTDIGAKGTPVPATTTTTIQSTGPICR